MSHKEDFHQFSVFQFALIRKLRPWNAEDPQNLTKDLNCFEQNSNSRLTVYRPKCNSLGRVPLTSTTVSFALFLIFGRLAIGNGFQEWQQYLYYSKTFFVIKKCFWTKLQIWYDCVSATMQQLGPSCLTTTILWVLPSSQLLADGRLTSVFVGGKLQDRFLTISCIHIDMLAWWNRALS